MSDERLAEPVSNADLFSALTTHGLLTEPLGAAMVNAAKFRNVLVHAYVDVDPAIVRDVVEDRLPDLDAYVAAVRAYLRAA